MAHIVPIKTNLMTLASLVFLTVLTVVTAKYIPMGHGAHLALAMFIACIKAGIVFAWFMHLKYEGLMNRVIALCGVAFLLLFFGVSAIDHFSR